MISLDPVNCQPAVHRARCLQRTGAPRGTEAACCGGERRIGRKERNLRPTQGTSGRGLLQADWAPQAYEEVLKAVAFKFLELHSKGDPFCAWNDRTV